MFLVVYNGRMRQFVILDGKGIIIWKRDFGFNGESRSKCILEVFNFLVYKIFKEIKIRLLININEIRD